MAKQAQLSPEKYIRTKARNLPLYECVVNANWNDGGIASIFIARKHSNGNITYGSYLVDLWCLGLKDTMAGFNVDIDEWQKVKDHIEGYGTTVERIDYVLAHNIIFGAIEFAADYEFKPHKDFALTQFILEEDDERIPIEDVEFGVDGKAHLVIFSGDNKAKAALNYLKANFEEGEFTYAAGVDQEFDDYDDNEAELDSEDYLPDDFFDNLDNADDDVVLDAADEIVERLWPHKLQIESLYQKHFATAPTYFSKVDFDNPDLKFEEQISTDYGDEINHLLHEMFEDGADEDDIKSAIQKYPHVPEFLLLLAEDYQDSGMEDEALELTRDARKRFPDKFSFVVNEVSLLCAMDRDEEALNLGREYYPQLMELGGKGLVCKNELSEFFMMLAASLSTQLIDDAQVCLDWLQYLHANEWAIKPPQAAVLVAKYGKLNDAGIMPAIF